MKNKEVKNVEIKKFINSKDKNMQFYNIKDLVKEGNVGDFCFVYQKANDEKRYISKNIIKLDLYQKLITTANGKIYRFCNEI